ncbi:MAG: hypothetical protein A4E57_00939 [Syntrophorhabdaceae bacterium PtaU1.Bin034]|nr:MAG: hypothetical protein A4E57_00939 [Syntrophorhabdaceae bacterium PtaU1.Bin034]
MGLHYETLFEVETIHTYFGPHPSAEFEIEPTPACAVVLLDHGLLFRKTAYGFCVLYECTTDGTGAAIPRRPLSDGPRFSFSVRAKNAYLVSFSALPLSGPEKGIFSLTNLTGNLRDGTYLLAADTTTPYVTGNDLVELRSMSFQYGVGGDGRAHTIRVMEGTGHVASEATIGPSAHPVGYNVNLINRKTGQYTIEVDDTEELRFYADDFLFRQRPFAVIDIFLGPEAPPGFSPVNPDGRATKKRYTVMIGRRNLFWRYLVALKYRTGVGPETMSITHPDPAVSFARGETRQAPDGTTIVPFVSGSELPLQSQAIPGITLQKNGNGSGSFSVENLPNASYENVVPDPETGRVYSDVYVYI